MLSRPPGWKTSSERLAQGGRDGDTAIRSALKELENFGYLRRYRHHNEDGSWEHHQEITDVPTVEQPELTPPDTIRGFSTDGLPTDGFPTDGKPTDSNNTESNNTYLSDVVKSPTTDAPAKRRGWWPSDAAIASATQLDPITDIPLSVTRYVVVKHERKQQPESAEWLKWFIEDEKKARAEERQNTASRFRTRKWYDVAE